MSDFEEWLEEGVRTAEAIRKRVGDADIAVYNTLLDKGIRPFYFFLQEKKGDQPSGTAADAGKPVRVVVTDADKDHKTYNHRQELRTAGLKWSNDAGGWTGTVQNLAAFKAKFEGELGLVVTVSG